MSDYSNNAVEAINFAIDQIEDHYERLEFLKCWQCGNWSSIDAEWPEFGNQIRSQ